MMKTRSELNLALYR